MNAAHKNLMSEKTILVTGGTGSWGHELVRQLLELSPDLKEIRIYSRGEHKQVEMRQEFANNTKIKFIIGDVRDKAILNHAMRGVNYVFHLAALKHVPVCEENSWEAVLTNIIGTQNVIEAAIKNGVEKVVDVSTDKAVDAFNLYGVTKACGEKLIINANYNYAMTNETTKFVCIRGGNVIGTNGSVIPLFKKQILSDNRITITDPAMTRYFMSTREAISLIFTALEHAIGGELFVMRMPSTTVQIMADSMVDLFGNEDTEQAIIGVRAGEKTHEVLVSKNEAPFTYELSSDYFVILPQICDQELTDKYSHLPTIEAPEFTSENAERIDRESLKTTLKCEKWLFEPCARPGA